jgi:hypothetical protein
MASFKNILLVVLIILLALSGLFISIQTGRLQVSGQYKALYESVFTTPEVWQAKDSTWHSKSETVVVSNPKIVQELSGLTEEIEGLKKNMKNFVSYNKIGTETTINKTLLIRDSVFTYTTKYDTITGRIRGDSIDLQGVTHVVLKEVQYWDRKWLLGKKKYFTEIIPEDTNTKVIVNRSIKAERKRGLFKNL